MAMPDVSFPRLPNDASKIPIAAFIASMAWFRPTVRAWMGGSLVSR